MLKNLKLFLMLVATLGMASCGSRSDNSCCWSDTCIQTEEWAPGSTCAGGPCAGPVECKQCPGDYVSVVRCMPQETPVGQDFNVTLTATAAIQCTDVVICEAVPEGLVYVSSDPAATVDGNRLTWDLGDLQCGECRQLCVTYQAREEGCFTSCYTINANPCCCQQIRVGCPKLQICKAGTECTRINCPVEYTIVVTNCGSMIAQKVTLTDQIPSELQHSSCCDKLTWDLGDLCPGESRTVNYGLTAIKCGKPTNTATAQSCGCPPVTAAFTTTVEHCCVKLRKTGPCGPIVVGKTADYTITAHNEGSAPLTNVKIIDIAPPGTRIKSAPGADVTGTRAVWTIPTFGANETMTFNVTLTSCVPGCLCNVVQVTCNENVGDCAQACTQWIGVAGLSACIKSSLNPVCVGMDTTYTLQLQNQGFADDTNVKVEIHFPPEIVPQQPAAGDGSGYKIQGSTVIFDTVPVLQAGRTINFSVTGRAVQTGDARVKAYIQSDLLTTPVVEEQATNVY